MYVCLTCPLHMPFLTLIFPSFHIWVMPVFESQVTHRLVHGQSFPNEGIADTGWRFLDAWPTVSSYPEGIDLRVRVALLLVVKVNMAAPGVASAMMRRQTVNALMLP